MLSQKSPFSSRIKIFLDGADRSTMVEMAKHPLVQGFTTNPSLMKKAGVKDYKGFCQEILNHVERKPISFEVFADDFPTMKKQAQEIASWDLGDKNVYVKIPICNSKGESSIPLIRELSQSGVKLNVTAIYTLKQVIATSAAAEKGASCLVSVFAGRISDTGRDPLPMMQASIEVCRTYGKNIELLWASTREAFNIVQADQMGCDIITAPLDMIKKVSQFNKEIDLLSIETVQTFKSDAESAGFRL